MSNDVLITPASRKIEFKDSGGNVDAKIETDSSGNLLITNAGGDISLGDTTGDIFIGDGATSVDIVMEVNGEIRGTSGVTITLGDSGSGISMGTDLGLNGNDITGTGNIDITGNIDAAGNLKLDASNSEINIKSGVGGTTGAVNWTFNTDSTNYAAIKLPYDTRASTGLHVDVGYPLTLDPTTRINFAISGTTYATFDTNGYNGQLNSYTEKARSDSVGTATYTINCNNENIITLTMTGNPTIAFSNVPSSGTAWSCTLILVHSGGARTVTWPSSVKWSGGSAPTLSTGSGDKDIITLFTVDGGTNWYGSSPGQDFS